MHRVFISYYHKEDQQYKNELIKKYGDICFLDNSVGYGEIDEYLSDEIIREKIRDKYLRDTTVTIVLLGPNTLGRKHVDWEISSSLIKSKHSSRSGLVGILLPSHPAYHDLKMNRDNTQRRFLLNYESGYAKLIKWENLRRLSKVLDDAYNERYGNNFDNSESLRERNS